MKQNNSDSYIDDYSNRTGKKTFYYGWIILIICLLLISMTYGIRFSYGVFFTSIEQDFSLNRAITSGIFSVYMLLGCIFAIIGGWLSDRFGPKMVFLVMGLFTFLGLSLSSQAIQLWQLFITYSLLVAVGTGPTYIMCTSIVTKWFSKRRGLAIALVTSGVGLGSIWMAPVATVLLTDFGWRISFIAIGLISLVVTTPCALLFRRNPQTADIQPGKQQNTKPDGFSLKQAVASKNFWLILLIWFFYSFCFFTVMTHIVPYATDSGISPMEAASILSLIGFTSIPGRILMGMVSDRYGRKLAGSISAFLMLLSMVILTQSVSLPALYIFSTIFGLSSGGLGPSTTAIIGDSFGVRHIGFIMGFIEIGWVTGAAVGPAIAGYIFDTTKSYFFAFLLGIVAAVFIVILIFLLRTPKLKGVQSSIH